MKARLVFTLSLLIFFLGCSEKEKLPKPTQDGAYTFGCKVDGKKWIANGRSGFGSPKPIGGGFVATGTLPSVIYIWAYRKNGEVIWIYLDKKSVGTYALNQDTPTMPAALHPKSYGRLTNAEEEEYVTSSRHTGQVTITRADTVRGIISGTFEFTAANAQGKKVKVTAGRFDFDQNH